MRFRLKAAVVVAALGTAVATTAAFAQWSSSATGTGTAQASHDSPSHITASVFAPDLYPGGTDTVTVTVDNPNAYAVIVTSISGALAPAVNGGACASGSVYTDEVNNPSGLTQAGTSTVTVAPHAAGSYAIAGHMVANPADACKDQVFSLSLTAALQSSSA
jgi:hypothetical protein